MGSIVVGPYLSPSGRAALQWAAQQARLTARKLVAINAVPIPPGLAPIGVLAMPETGMDESKMDPAYREAIHAVWESVLPKARLGTGVCPRRCRTRAGQAICAGNTVGCWHPRACWPRSAGLGFS